MLRPLLEQAVDPISSNGEIKIPKYLNINKQKTTEQAATEQATTEQILPSTAILFKPSVI
jgi:hypothetical protein